MLRSLFSRGGQAQHFVSRHSAEAFDGGHLRLSAGKSPRLVEGGAVYLGETFQSVPRPDQDPVFRQIADGSGDSRRRREYEGAGAEYDQHRDGAHKFAGNEPDDQRTSQRDRDHP